MDGDIGDIQRDDTLHGPVNGLRNIVKFQVQKDAGVRGYLVDFMNNVGPGLDKELQADLENTHMIPKKRNIASGFADRGNIQGEDEIVSSFLHGRNPFWLLFQLCER